MGLDKVERMVWLQTFLNVGIDVNYFQKTRLFMASAVTIYHPKMLILVCWNFRDHACHCLDPWWMSDSSPIPWLWIWGPFLVCKVSISYLVCWIISLTYRFGKLPKQSIASWTVDLFMLPIYIHSGQMVVKCSFIVCFY